MTRVLVIDEAVRDQERYCAFLAAEGREIIVCPDGAGALQLVAGDSPPFQVVVLLWELTGQTKGAELLIRLHRAHPELPIIVVSGLLDLSRLATAKALGARDFLLKPLDRKRLVEAVEGVLAPEGISERVHALANTILGQSPAMLAVFKSLAQVIDQKAESVLLVGESGTGKELLAQAFHDLSEAVKDGPWVPVNMAAIPPALVESHLFGHEMGAFTDAKKQRVGAFEESKDGVLFLDEIGEMASDLQAKLLRVIQERTFRRVGGAQDLRFTGRLVCATNRNLVSEVKTGRFREDLYYRIATHEIRIPPLRERTGDVWLLTDYFLAKHASGRKVRLAREARELLAKYSFPGNVRELEDILKRALLECRGEEILPYHLPVNVMDERQVQPAAAKDLEAVEWPERLFGLPQKEALEEIEKAFNRQYLPRKLEEANHNIERATKAAGWKDDKTLRDKWEKAGLGPLGDRR